jgi:hypothetical protein
MAYFKAYFMEASSSFMVKIAVTKVIGIVVIIG